jgi:hypothetical protein
MTSHMERSALHYNRGTALDILITELLIAVIAGGVLLVDALR